MQKVSFIYRWLLTLLLLAISACDTKDGMDNNANNVLQPCPGFVETGLPPLVYGAECGTLWVKENPDDSASKEIAVEILRLPAISPAAQQDPLFLIQGGPGGSSIDMAVQLHGFFADVRKNRDLIFVDQRGTGKSSPLHCPRLSDEDMQLPEAEQEKKYLHLIEQCANTYKDNAAFYTTPYAVRDLDEVRAALGYQKINLWGGSYGTRVALQYARRYPEQARSVVLDGLAPVAIALPRYFARDALAALTAVNNECLAQEACVREFGDILQKAEMVYARLQAAELQGNHQTIEYAHPRYLQTEKFSLTAKNFSALIFMSLYSRDLTVLLPRAISYAEQGDYRLLAVLYALAGESLQNMKIAEGMRYSIICNEDWYGLSHNDVATTQPFFAKNFMQDMAGICALWPKASLPEDYWVLVKSQVPALLLSGKHDPVTPETWAEQVAVGLPNSTRLLAAGGNHVVSTEGCLPQIIAQFIERASMQGINTACVANIKPLPLVLGANQKQSATSAASEGAQP